MRVTMACARIAICAKNAYAKRFQKGQIWRFWGKIPYWEGAIRKNTLYAKLAFGLQYI